MKPRILVLLILVVAGVLFAVRQSDPNGNTRLIAAASRNHVSLMRVLIGLGTDLDHQNVEGDTALSVAAGRGHEDTVALLLKHKARTDLQTPYGPALCAATRWGFADVARLLLAAGADINQRDARTGYTALIATCAHERLDTSNALRTARVLLEHGANLDAQDKNGWTCLMWAIWNDHRALVPVLVERGANINLQNNAGETALVKATQRGHMETIAYLKARGAGMGAPVAAKMLVAGDRPPSKEQWALATAALLTQLKRGQHGVLGAARTRDSARQELRDDHGLETRDAVLTRLDWLLAEGDRKSFAQIADQLGALPEAEFMVWIAGKLDDPPAIVQAKFVRRDRAQAGPRGIVAWDLCRCVYLASLATAAEYLRPDEAWVKIHSAAAQLQNQFGAWRELGQNFLIGQRFSTCRSHPQAEVLLDLLCNPQGAGSPWTQCPWELRPY